MIIQDKIYGKLTISEPVIVDLINSQPLQRLKKINQYGAPFYIQPYLNTTRFEHSVGAWYLSHKYNRPIEEQIASLLHDIPHTAFSHTIDFVMNDPRHEYHDRFIKQVIMQSEIPDILKQHNVSLEKVLHKENFPLLDNNLPDISVDRWDYFLRDGYTGSFLSQETINLFLGSMYEKDNKFYFTDVRIASELAIMFMNMSRLIWLAPTSHGAFFLLAEAMKIALKKQLITEEDFFTTDDVMMKKLREFADPEMDMFLNRLEVGKVFVYASKKDADFYGPNKPRFVDPWVIVDEKLQTLSSIVPTLSEYFEEFTERYGNIGVRQV